MTGQNSWLPLAAQHPSAFHRALHFLQQRRKFGLGLRGALAVKRLQPDFRDLVLKLGAQDRVGVRLRHLSGGGHFCADVFHLPDGLVNHALPFVRRQIFKRRDHLLETRRHGRFEECAFSSSVIWANHL